MPRTTLRYLCVLLCLVGARTSPVHAGEWAVKSPDGTRVLTVSLTDAKLSYCVRLNGEIVLEQAPLGIRVSGDSGDFTNGLAFVSTESRTIDETYAMISGKASRCVNRANETLLTFTNTQGARLELYVRAYDDGVAYRYGLPGEGPVEVVAEQSGFRVPEDARGWLQQAVAHYENPYIPSSLADVKDGQYSFPALFELHTGAWVLLTEAAVYGDSYGANHLGGPTSDGVFSIQFAGGNYTGERPLFTPWRVAIIGTLADIVESTLVENLNPPCEIEDTSWIRPGRVAWSWWTDGGSPGNLDVQKQYVDFAAEMGWEYILVDCGWDPQWVPELVKYASEKRVSVLLWCNWNDVRDLDEQRNTLALWKSWGVAGIKVDYMDSDSQERMQFYDSITRTAIANKLMICFHGATIPRGQRRRWPNIMTMEGVRGAEYDRDQYRPTTPAHNCILPYTRNVVGPMDCTPVAFSARQRASSLAHELALSVVFESGWQHFADSPASYGKYPPAVEFLKLVATAWDETRFVAGRPGELVCIARRKGDAWFLGVIAAGDERTIEVPLSFLGAGTYEMTLWEDDETADQFHVETKDVTSADRLQTQLKTNGGLTARFKPR
jgi:alpha-glucosidase